MHLNLKLNTVVVAHTLMIVNPSKVKAMYLSTVKHFLLNDLERNQRVWKIVITSHLKRMTFILTNKEWNQKLWKN